VTWNDSGQFKELHWMQAPCRIWQIEHFYRKQQGTNRSGKERKKKEQKGSKKGKGESLSDQGPSLVVDIFDPDDVLIQAVIRKGQLRDPQSTANVTPLK